MRRLVVRASDRLPPSQAGRARGAPVKPRTVHIRVGAPRHRRRSDRRNLPWRRVGLALAVSVLVGLAVAAWHSGVADRFAGAVIDASAKAGFVVREVLVEGREQAPLARIDAALGIKRGQPILSIDPAAAKQRLEALIWIESAEVERRLPDKVYVRLREQRPMTRWQRQGRVVLVDRAGDVIEGADPARFRHLPLVVGADAAKHWPELAAILTAQPALHGLMTAAIWVGGRRWTLRLSNGIDVKLPEQGAGAALARLAARERDFGLFRRDIGEIDLRLPDRMTVRLKPTDDADTGDAAGPAGAGKDA